MKKIYHLFIVLLIFAACKTQDLPSSRIDVATDSLLTKIQLQTFQYFWDGAELNSGLARERVHMDNIYPQNDKDVITIGGSGFGLMNILVAEERKFISSEEALSRLEKSINYLNSIPRFKGAYAHWYDGPSKQVKSFSEKDNGGDIVETAFLAQGLICVREYYKNKSPRHQNIANLADKLWKEIQWNHYTNDKDVIYWHWSPEHDFGMNHPIQGFDECFITYILASASPTYPIKNSVLENGWNRNGAIETDIKKYQIPTIAKHNATPGEVGPLFWAHYSFLGLSPIGLKDKYIDYEAVVKNHAEINIRHAELNPNGYKGYGKSKGWGLTASYSINGYDAHHPDNDKGVISPTAALASIPYTPNESISFAKYLFKELESKTWGKYGFYDAYSEQYNWYPKRYLAIDQGPITIMIENYRSKLIWNLFMNAPEIHSTLKNIGFKSPYIN